MDRPNESLPKRREAEAEMNPFRDFFQSPIMQRPSIWGGAGDVGSRWAPAMDIAESPEGYAVTVEIPGARKEDVTVECHDNLLTIKGEKRDEREERDEHRHFVERSYGSFSRSFRLPADASDDIEASFRDGVLTVEVRKEEEKKPRVVSID